MGGPSHIPISGQNDSVNEFVNIATDPSPTDNPQINSTTLVTTPQTTDVVHISRKKNECSFLLKIGDRKQQALWDSDAGRCVLSHNFYQSIPSKMKTELFPGPIKIRAANGTFISNKGECDISFTIGTEKFTFQFLCSDQLSQDIIVGHNFSHVFYIGSPWSVEDVMSLTYNGKHLIN